VFAPALPQESPHGQSIYLVTILTVYGVAQAHVWPWKAPEFNLLDVCVTVLLTTIIAVAMSFMDKGDTDAYAYVLVLVLIIMGCGMAALVIRIANGWLRSRTANGLFSMDGKSPNKDLAVKLHNLVVQTAALSQDEFMARFEKMAYYDRCNAFTGISVFARADQIRKRLPVGEPGFDSESSTASPRSVTLVGHAVDVPAVEKEPQVNLLVTPICDAPVVEEALPAAESPRSSHSSIHSSL
jgi:hypothetical protein